MRFRRAMVAALLAMTLMIPLSPSSSLASDGLAQATTSEAEIVRLTQEHNKLKAELRRTRSKALRQKRRGDYWRLRCLSRKRVWSKADTRWVTKRALVHYRIPKSEWSWVLAANQTIIYGYGKGTPRESSGRTKARTGQYLGLHQWGASWKGSEEQKTSGRWSCYRFVRCYRDGRRTNDAGAAGGKGVIRAHWSATLGPYRSR